ncbi:MAG TPA: hypothetical protein VGC30_14750 [Dokdonella sp.]
MTDHPANASADLEISQGTVGLLGAARIGVKAVAVAAPAFAGAPAVATATVVVAQTIAGVFTETTLRLREGALLPLADGGHRVLRVVPPGVHDNKGRVDVEREPREAAVRGAVIATADGMLRIGGPSIDDAIDLAVLSFAPDERAPRSAEIEWRPAAFARKDTPPERIRRETLSPGRTLALPRASLKVASVDGSTPDRPARVVFEVAPKP